MTFNLDNTVITIDCPKCRKKLKEKIGRLKREKHITCPACGLIAVDTDQLRRIDATINKQLAQLSKSIKINLKF